MTYEGKVFEVEFTKPAEAGINVTRRALICADSLEKALERGARLGTPIAIGPKPFIDYIVFPDTARG